MDTQAQMQAIVAKLVGNTGARLPPIDALDEPWRTFYRRVKRVSDFTEAELMLYGIARDLQPAPEGLLGIDEDPRRGEAVTAAREIVDLLPSGYAFCSYPSLQEMERRFADVRWLWPGWIPRGMVTLLGAAPGMGKSLLALDLARRILAGEPFPDGGLSIIPTDGC